MDSNNKKHILFIGNYPPPYGGVPRHFEYLIPHLLKNNWVVDVLSGGNSGIMRQSNLTVYKPTEWQRRFNYARQMLHKPKHEVFRRLHETSPSDWLRYMIYIEIGRHIIERQKIQLISVYNMYSYAPIGAYLSELYDIPLIVTNFGEFYSHQSFFKKNPQLAEYVIKRSIKLLAMSNHCSVSYKEIGLRPDVEVIPYGVDTKMFKPENDGTIIRRRFGLSADEVTVLFIGRLCKDMGLSTLLEAADKLAPTHPNIKFIIAGEPGDSLTAVQTLAQRYPKQIFYATSVPFDELPMWYAAGSIIVAPTQGKRACGSLSAIEAMSTGKPIIAADIGGIPEIVQHDSTGKLVEANNSDSLANCIVQLCSLAPTDLKKFGAAGRASVEARFNEEQLDQQFERLFRELAKTS
ncbi:MAG: Glycosyl transferase, group 1 [uncultured bacterium]|nr:MAG: Glycosyl transferase, group 1 [uncultured bacterium]